MRERPYALWILVVAALASALLGALLTDAMVDDATEALPEPPVAQVVPAGGEVPGGLVGEVEAPLPAPLFEDATPVYETVYDEEGVPQLSDPAVLPGQPGDPGAAPDPGVTTTTIGGAAALDADDFLVARFLDVCTMAPSGCPPGVAATVLYAANQDPPPPVDFVVIPEASLAVYPSLRCDPGVPSQTAIPLVLLSNRPFDLLHVRLRTADGVLLDEIVNTRSDPSEFTHFDQRRVAGKPLAPTPMDGAHTCILLRTDARVGSAPERTGQFEVFVQGYADQSYRAKTVTFTGGYDARRPPVQFLPQSANRAHVIVPQIAGDTVVMWVHERYTGAPGCDGTPPSLDTRAVRQTPASLPREYSPSALASPDYPWDRTYSHFTVWNLDLRSSTDYTVCIRWVIEDRGEEWYLETPDGIDLYVGAGPLRHTRSVVAGTLLVRMYGVSGCFVANPHGQSDLWPKFPDQNLFGDDTYLYTFPDMCHSGGRFIGPKIQIQALFADGTNDVYGMIEVPTQVLVDNCTDVGTGQPSGPCTRRLEWRNRNVLCGGGFGTPSCQGDLFFGLDIYFRVTVRDWNNRPDPLDWGVFPIARLAPDDGGALQPVPFP